MGTALMKTTATMTKLAIKKLMILLVRVMVMTPEMMTKLAITKLMIQLHPALAWPVAWYSSQLQLEENRLDLNDPWVPISIMPISIYAYIHQCLFPFKWPPCLFPPYLFSQKSDPSQNNALSLHKDTCKEPKNYHTSQMKGMGLRLICVQIQ